MNTEITVNKVQRGQIFFDATCPLCVRSATRATRLTQQLGFDLLPLQTPGAAETLLARMHLLTADGRCFAGADAFVEIARHARWAQPLVALTRLPVVLLVLRRCCDWIAASRHCIGGTRHARPSHKTKRVFFEMP